LRQQLAVALGRFLAKLHLAGIRHDDLHAGNILIRIDEDDRFELFLIDLDEIRLGPALAESDAWRNLVVLNHWFLMRASRSDRLRFWRSYRAARGLGDWKNSWPKDPEPRRRARQLELDTWESLHRMWRQRTRHCLENNRHFRRLKGARFVGHAVTDLDPALIETLLKDPDAPFERPGAVVLKDSASSTVIELDGIVNGRPRRLVWKRFGVVKTWKPWLGLLRATAAERSWMLGQGFRERGLPTARPLLLMQRRRLGLVGSGYLLMEKVEHALSLHYFLDSLATLPADEGRRILRRRIETVARALGDMHRRNISHRDLKASNLLLAEVGAPAPPPDAAFVSPALEGLWFIDLVGAAVHGKLSRPRRVQNLARLNASFHDRPDLTRTDRLRFLRCYLQWHLMGKQRWKAWWRTIARATQAKIDRNQRLGRVLA
jgi:tRNA A-37 threonylcarbamoyl transferase component Bud32